LDQVSYRKWMAIVRVITVLGQSFGVNLTGGNCPWLQLSCTKRMQPGCSGFTKKYQDSK